MSLEKIARRRLRQIYSDKCMGSEVFEHVVWAGLEDDVIVKRFNFSVNIPRASSGWTLNEVFGHAN